MIVLFNKPFNVLSQFTDTSDRATLSDYIPLQAVYAAGRLDKDSEGLLVLTDEGHLQHLISHPAAKLIKTYWAQVEGQVQPPAIDQLRSGVTLKDGITAPAGARIMVEPTVWPRSPPIRYRAAIPTTWIEIQLSEGRNRQVRRMTAAVGHPTLRLIRYATGPWCLGTLNPGQYSQVSPQLIPDDPLLRREWDKLFGKSTNPGHNTPRGKPSPPHPRRRPLAAHSRGKPKR